MAKVCTAVLVLCGILWTAYYLGATDHVGFGPSRPDHAANKGFHYTKPANEVNEGAKPDAVKEPIIPAEKEHRPFSSHAAIDVVVPEGVKVIALIFFGRKEYVTILDCYLRVCLLLLSFCSS